MRKVQAALAGAIAATVFGIAPTVAHAAATDSPTAGYTVAVFATGSTTTFGPDDITRLGRDILVAWQNGVGPDGSPSSTGNTHSTVVEYTPDGSALHKWSLDGHIDGLTADPAHHRVIATSNEDANSSLYTIVPGAPSAAMVHHYQYAPSPLPHGGGTDAISIVAGRIFISASNPSNPAGPAVYQAKLSRGVATLRPVFFDNSSATVANTNATDYGQTVSLALTDPDSNEAVPAQSPRFGGDFVLDSQGDEQQIYLSRSASNRTALHLLRLSQSIDDTAYITDRTGTLYATDAADNEVFAVTGSFHPGDALVAVTPADANNPVNAPNYLGRLNLWNGDINPLITSIQAKGLVFVPGAQDQR